MELDGYYNELKIAFEYQGEQHFSQGFFVKTRVLLDLRKEDDLKKKELCELNNIKLVVISFWEQATDYSRRIEGQLLDLNFPIKNLILTKK
jgi:hypothetical protein